MITFVIENGKHKRPDGSNASSICADYGQSWIALARLWEDIRTTPAEIVDWLA